MNLQTSTVPAVENCESLSNSYDIKLLGPHSPYGPDNTFSQVFSSDSKFYYRIDQLYKNSIVKYEVGIGYLEGNILKRFRPLYHGLKADQPAPSANGPQYFVPNEGEQLVASSYLPRAFHEALCDAHTVVASVAPFVPHPVSLAENSFLGRLNDNVESIPFSSLFTSKELIDLITRTIISYISTLLTTKSVCTDNLQLNVVKKPPKTKGTLSFDGENLKYYDGKKYRVLQWRFEDE
jgi:hypothetical protein